MNSIKSGFVGLIGRPNTGKSTLVNTLIGSKIAITSNKAGTTRNNIQGIFNDDDSQIVFVDTPGIHKPVTKLGGLLNKQAFFSISDVDIILYMVDATEKFGKGEEFVIEKLKEEEKPVFLIINKIDKLDREQILKKIIEFKDKYDFAEIIPVSALKERNTDDIVKTLKKYLPDQIKYYEEGTITNKKTSFIVSEIVREKILQLTKEEVPHSVMCIVEEMTSKKDKVIIIGTIIVDRDNLKRIIIGRQGQMIKTVGTMARKDMENMFEKTVFLDLRVKTVKSWRDSDKYLKEYGYNELE